MTTESQEQAHHLFKGLLLTLRLARQLGAAMSKAGNVLLRKHLTITPAAPLDITNSHSPGLDAAQRCWEVAR